MKHRFQRPELLEQALTHSSFARELQDESGKGGKDKDKDQHNKGRDAMASLPSDNEQLEFLGDAVLGLVTSRELFERFPHFQEGQLSKTRAFLVSEQHLVGAARRLHLGRYLRLGRGEEKSGGRDKPAILVDALEAVLAALYLDAGLEAAQPFIVEQILKPQFRRLSRNGGGELPISDYKSALQETAHSLGLAPPSYVVVGERGPEHCKTFTVEARVAGSGKPDFIRRAEGPTKKAAEQAAARRALRRLQATTGAKSPAVTVAGEASSTQ
ncbi:MAG: ribonuclease III [Candidatus Korobacteraceae bacterium]